MKPRCTSEKCIKSRFCQQFYEEMRSDYIKNLLVCYLGGDKTYVTSMVTSALSHRDTTRLGVESRRTYTFNYSLKHGYSERLQVCKIMFLNTLGLND